MNRKDFIFKSTATLLFAGVSVLGFGQESEKSAKKYTVVEKRCEGCGHCTNSCKEKALTFSPQGKAVIDPKKCKGCGDCVRFCRHMAIEEVTDKK